MSRRIRTAALVSATTLLVGGSLALGLAPTASAVDLPNLGDLSLAPAAPTIGQTVNLSGTGCINPSPQPFAASADPTGAPVASASPTGGNDPVASTVDITITTPDGSTTSKSASPDLDGAWTEETGFKIDQAGKYTFDATCDLGVLGGQADYDPLVIDVAAQSADPSVVVTPGAGQSVAPGGKVTVAGVDFDGATSVDVSLQGYTTVTGVAVTSGGFSGVVFTMSADQASATLTGTVTPTGGGLDPVDYSVTVVAPTSTSTMPTPPSADGTVTNDDDTSGSGYGSGYTPSRGYTASKPTLPNTGTDSLWPGVVGALLVLSGAGLVWSGRRREQAGTHAA